jgi:hypothetical protein
MSNSGKISTSKIIGIILTILLCAGVLFFLGREVKGTVRTQEVIPKLGKEPVYVELSDGVSHSAVFTPSRDLNVQGLEIVLVNTDEASGSGEPSVLVSVSETGSGELLDETGILLSDVEAGSWSTVPMSFYMEEGKNYEFTFTPVGCQPYFMRVAGYEMGISVGFQVIEDENVTLAEMFYYSVPAVILLAIFAILYIVFEEALFTGIGKLIGSEKFKAVWNVAFLLLLFVVLSLKIYQEGYIDGIYISADSDGYLREAVNLVNGNGFSYEGLAGYKSHFANWPIIYPAMIAASMMITGANAYLASKYVAIFVVALIFVTLFFEFKNRSWLYALAFTNVGFLTLCYYTWSEVPFEWFLLMFALMLGRIVEKDKPGLRSYVLLSVFGTAAFLTRYFGIYAWFVAGAFWIIFLVRFIKGKKTGADVGILFGKLKGLFISAASSGVLCVLYLVMNKIRNGYPTGVSRGTWWDDYVTLTNDLVTSLVTEAFNVFSLDVPAYINGMTVAHQALFVLGVIVILLAVAKGSLGDKGAMSTGFVFVAMAVFYYVMFIVVRYRSSMDTFYFRFFAPATVLLVIGIINLVLEKSQHIEGELRVLAAVMTLITLVSFTDLVAEARTWKVENNYYDIATAEWDEEYKEIPQKSTVIWNDINYRSSWYRPDVYGGELFTEDTWESVAERYAPSDYICMKREDAMAVVDSGEYDKSLTDKLSDALGASDVTSKYIVIAN